MIDYISAYSILAPTLVGAIVFIGLNKQLKALYALVAITVVFEFVAIAIVAKGMNNMWMMHSYSYVEYTVIVSIFFSITYSKIVRAVLISLTIVFFAFSVFNLIYFESLNEFNSNQRYVEGIAILAMCVMYFGELLFVAEYSYLEKNPFFWLASGYLIYFAGTLFLFLFNKNLHKQDLNSYWILHGILNIWLNLIYTVTLWIGRRKLES